MKTDQIRQGRKEAGNKAANPAPAEPENKQDLELTEAGIQKLIQDGVKGAIDAQRKADEEAAKKAADDKAAADKAAAEKAAKEQPAQPQQPASQFTAENVKQMIDQAIADAVKAARDQSRQDAGVKQTRSTEDAATSRVEIPVAWCKGNLPLHGKQLLNILQGKSRDTGISAAQLADGQIKGDNVLTKMRGAKAWSSTGSGYGDELVPSDLSAELQRRLYLASEVMAVMASREIMMPTNPFTYPVSTTRPTFYLEASENTAKTESSPATSNVALSARLIAAKVLFSYEVDEDSIIAVLPTLQQLLADAAADALEDAYINGDTTATHMDSDTETVAKHVARSWKGWRRLLLTGTLAVDCSTGGISSTNIKSCIKLMDKYGIMKRDLVIIAGPKGYNDLLSDTNIVTADKIGGGATILTGRVPTLWGVPVIVSARCRENLNASAVYDGSTTTKGSFLVVHLPSYVAGSRRDFMVETFRDIDVQQTKVVFSMRKAFSPIETPSATIQTGAIGYNYAA